MLKFGTFLKMGCNLCTLLDNIARKVSKMFILDCGSCTLADQSQAGIGHALGSPGLSNGSYSHPFP